MTASGSIFLRVVCYLPPDMVYEIDRESMQRGGVSRSEVIRCRLGADASDDAPPQRLARR